MLVPAWVPLIYVSLVLSTTTLSLSLSLFLSPTFSVFSHSLTRSLCNHFHTFCSQHIRVPGDTVHIEFEMKSGRESSTPDHAMWGFKISIRDREHTTESKTAFPFHTVRGVYCVLCV